MKRSLLLTAVLLSCLFSFAQKSKAYLKGGLNFANISINSNGDVDEANVLTSFHVGFMGDLPVGEFFAFQTSFLFTGKGSKMESGDPNGLTWYKATTNPLYIEVPVTAVFKLPVAKASNFFFGAGPYIAVGIGGKRKIEGQNAGFAFSSKENIRFSNDDPTTLNYEEGSGFGIMKRFDYGLNGTIGLQMNNGLLSVNYGYGLAKLQSGAGNDDKNNKHRVLSLSVGFKL